MKHPEALIAAVERELLRPTDGPLRGHAISVLDALRAAEALEAKTDRQALVDTIADALVVSYRSGRTTSDQETVADAILADFHVSLREDETEPLLRTTATAIERTDR